MKRVFLVILAVVSLPLHAQKPLGEGIKELATQITTSAAKQDKQKIAVLPFHELEGRPTILGTYLAEELVTNLFQLGNFKIVERQLLDRVMGELRVEQSGAIDSKTAKEIGRIAAVDAIVTGSITDLESFVAVNCRLIDTTTGEVFGAAQTKITKDEDVNKIMRTSLAAVGATASGSSTSYPSAKAIAMTDIGLLRVTLKSAVITRQSGSNGQRVLGVRCTLELTNRDSQRPVFVAFNAIPGEPGHIAYLGYSGQPILIGDVQSGDVLRTTLVDETGTVWILPASGVTGLSFVSAGKKDPYSVSSPSDIPSLLSRQDEAGTNLTSDPRTLTPNQKYAFVFGTATAIPPGQSVTVPMSFDQRRGEVVPDSPPKELQIVSEIVVGVVGSDGKAAYSLHNLMFDRIRLSTAGVR
jgi:curli biogenesis system outer membrane secretion channel CsgG